MAHPFGRSSVSARAARWIAVCLFLVSAATANASTIYYGYQGTVSSTAGSSGPANVMVRFTLLNNIIEVAIWNFQADVKADISTLNSVDFVLSGQQTTGTITQRSGMELNFPDSGRNITPQIVAGGTTAFTNDPDPGWQLIPSTFYTGTGLELSSINGNHDHTIVGPAGPGGVFSNINSSMPRHNPYLYTPSLSAPVQFTLNVPGVTENDTVTYVRFGFGTDDSAEYRGYTPEPATWCLVGTGLLGAFIWRRKRAKSKA